MVSIWMLCTSRTPGSERHKALQAGLRPRAPQGPPARPQRQTLSAARPSAPAKPAREPAAGEPELQEGTPAARRVGRSLASPGRVPPGPSPEAWQVLRN